MRRPAIARGRRSLLVLLVVVVWWSGGATPVAAAPARPEEGEIERLYRAALGRQAEIGGLHYWVKRRQTDLTLEAIASFFLASAEFDRRFGAPDDLSFVTLVYAQVLERVPDEGGRRYWLDRLAGGLSRQRLVLLFSESPEFMDRTGTRPPVLPSFEATVRGVSTDDLGASWRSGCPVGPSRLRLVEVSHVTATGGSATGRIVVHESVAGAVVGVFERLYVARFPIERMQTIDAFGGDDNASMDANNTSGVADGTALHPFSTVQAAVTAA